MARITFRDPLGGISTSLELGLEAVQDLTVLMRRLIPRWAESRDQMYATQGFGQWPGYQASERQYLAIKGGWIKRRATNADLMQVAIPGKAFPPKLRRSLTDPGSTQFIGDATHDGLRLGTKVPYATAHERGGAVAPMTLGGHTIPRRRILMMGNFAGKVADEFSQYAGELGAAIANKRGDVLRALSAGR